MVERRFDDVRSLACVGGEDHPAVGAFESAKAEPALDRGAMLTQRRVARGIVGEGVG
ncbi:hypothetical protein ACUXAI_003854 [Sphingomonas sanguinis]|jgi:hypothetical protein